MHSLRSPPTIAKATSSIAATAIHQLEKCSNCQISDRAVAIPLGRSVLPICIRQLDFLRVRRSERGRRIEQRIQSHRLECRGDRWRDRLQSQHDVSPGYAGGAQRPVLQIGHAHQRGPVRRALESRIPGDVHIVADEEKLIVSQLDRFTVCVPRLRNPRERCMASTGDDRRQSDRLIVDVESASFKS